MSPIALLSVSDKTDLIPLAQALINELGFRIISSGGTAKLLESANLPVTRVADYTGFPEILEGRVKTLNPKIHGGILARRDKQTHLDDLTCEVLQFNVVRSKTTPYPCIVILPHFGAQSNKENHVTPKFDML